MQPNIDIMKKLIYGAALLAIAGMSACAPKNTKNEANAPLPLPDAAYDSTYVKEVSEAADEQIVVTETPTPGGGENITDTISQDTVVSDGSTIVPQ
jgi:hypothetical protein